MPEIPHTQSSLLELSKKKEKNLKYHIHTPPDLAALPRTSAPPQQEGTTRSLGPPLPPAQRQARANHGAPPKQPRVKADGSSEKRESKGAERKKVDGQREAKGGNPTSLPRRDGQRSRWSSLSPCAQLCSQELRSRGVLAISTGGSLHPEGAHPVTAHFSWTLRLISTLTARNRQHKAEDRSVFLGPWGGTAAS